MARFRRARTVYRTARRASSRAGGTRGLMGYIAPFAGGAGDVFVKKFIPINGVASTVAGMFLKDQVTMKIGLNKAGESVGAMFAEKGQGGSLGGWL